MVNDPFNNKRRVGNFRQIFEADAIVKDWQAIEDAIDRGEFLTLNQKIQQALTTSVFVRTYLARDAVVGHFETVVQKMKETDCVIHFHEAIMSLATIAMNYPNKIFSKDMHDLQLESSRLYALEYIGAILKYSDDAIKKDLPTIMNHIAAHDPSEMVAIQACEILESLGEISDKDAFYKQKRGLEQRPLQVPSGIMLS